MKHVKLKKLKKHLSTKKKKELVDDIGELFKKFEDVKDYYTSQLSTKGRIAVVKEYKRMIRNGFFSPEEYGGGIDLPSVYNAIESFFYISESFHDKADIMIYLVEQGVGAANEYGEMYEVLYDDMAEAYEEALKFIVNNGLKDDFRERCWDIVQNAPKGWGFNDLLSDLFDEYRGED